MTSLNMEATKFQPRNQTRPVRNAQACADSIAKNQATRSTPTLPKRCDINNIWLAVAANALPTARPFTGNPSAHMLHKRLHFPENLVSGQLEHIDTTKPASETASNSNRPQSDTPYYPLDMWVMIAPVIAR